MPSGRELDLNIQGESSTPLTLDIESDAIQLDMDIQETSSTPMALSMQRSGGHDIEMTVNAGGEAPASNAEAWAVGERHGVPVAEGDPTYENNALYYAQLAAQAATGGIIDDTAGDGDTDKLWSANKIYDELALKISTSAIATTSETQAIISEYT